MKYISTRGDSPKLGFLEAVATGLAPDGGLYLPEQLPDIGPYLADWKNLDYSELCEAFFKLFATDMDSDELRSCIQDAYASFTHPDISPLHALSDDLFVLELFHGPTLAFKDFALQLLGNLYEAQIRRTGKKINILGATSGDTGAAAIHGLLGKEGVEIFILYPAGGVSALQERQMSCTGADNVHTIAIEGTFDDAQSSIKEIFGDLDFRSQYALSAVNSINLARVLAQCVYYIFAWCRLREVNQDNVTFVVPTGNFGNVLAGWMTQRMGLPVKGFQIATNQNDILYRLFTGGRYEKQEVHRSHAPSMDIQIASNFERFLYFHENGDIEKVNEVMASIKETGTYIFDHFDADTFSAVKADDDLIKEKIDQVYQDFGYVCDPHTACGFADLPEEGTRIVLGTAHPAKFPEVIFDAIKLDVTSPVLEQLKDRPIVRKELPADTSAIRNYIEETLLSERENPS